MVQGDDRHLLEASLFVILYWNILIYTCFRTWRLLLQYLPMCFWKDYQKISFHHHIKSELKKGFDSFFVTGLHWNPMHSLSPRNLPFSKTFEMKYELNLTTILVRWICSANEVDIKQSMMWSLWIDNCAEFAVFFISMQRYLLVWIKKLWRMVGM